MSGEVRTTAVSILGREYKIRTTESEEFVQEVAQYVDAMMNRIASKMSSGTTSQIAVLAALNIAEEMFRLRRSEENRREEADSERSGLDDRVRSLMDRLDEVVGVARGPKLVSESRAARIA